MNSTSSFPFLFHFCLLGGFCAQLFLISFIWGCTIASDTTFPYYFLFFFILYPPPSSMAVRRTFGCEQTHNFCLIKVSCYLAEGFDNIFVNWAIIHFFLLNIMFELTKSLIFSLSFKINWLLIKFVEITVSVPISTTSIAQNTAAARWALHPRPTY